MNQRFTIVALTNGLEGRKKMMNKGQANQMLLSIFLLLGIGFIGWQLFQGVQQTAVSGGVQEQAEQQQKLVQQLTSPEGKAATVRYAALDGVSDPRNAQLAVAGIYAIEMNGNGEVLIANNVSSSATARTSVSTSTGKTLKAVAFDSLRYGDLVETKVDKETISVDLPVYTIATGLNVSLEDRDGVVRRDTNLNITLAASQTDTWSYLEIENTDTDSLFRWKALGFDLATASNVSDLDVAGMRSAPVPERRRSVVDFYFEFPEAVSLKEFEKFKTGRVKWEADGDNPAEDVTMYVVDIQHYKTQDNKLAQGVEDDQTSPVDLGLADVSRTLRVQ